MLVEKVIQKPINKYEDKPTSSHPINNCKKLFANTISNIENVKKLV